MPAYTAAASVPVTSRNLKRVGIESELLPIDLLSGMVIAGWRPIANSGYKAKDADEEQTSNVKSSSYELLA
jgi:hypothetical protein